MAHTERLEPRRLFASVSQGFPGYYEIFGTDGPDTIVIAVDQFARTFKLDGVTYPGLEYVVIYGMGGADTLGAFASGSGPVAVAIDGGEGMDDCTVSGLSGAVWGGGGDDTVRLADSLRGEAYGEDGSDYLVVAGNSPGAFAVGGSGGDVINALGSSAGVVMVGGDGADRIYGSQFDDLIFGGSGSDFLFGAGGRDEFHTRDGELDWVMGGGDFDTLFADGAEGGINGLENVVYL